MRQFGPRLCFLKEADKKNTGQSHSFLSLRQPKKEDTTSIAASAQTITVHSHLHRQIWHCMDVVEQPSFFLEVETRNGQEPFLSQTVPVCGQKSQLMQLLTIPRVRTIGSQKKACITECIETSDLCTHACVVLYSYLCQDKMHQNGYQYNDC